jgi:Fur family peroxide stress response transcriptional regulator
MPLRLLINNNFPVHVAYGKGADLKNPQKRLDEILSKLRQRECRITPQRIAILKTFIRSDEHPSVEQVHAQVKINFPTTSLATVYKTVNLLKEIGEILELSFPDGRNRYDGRNPYPHPHLICTHCQAILDPTVSSVEQMTTEIEQSSGYCILSHQLEFFGVCPACQKK